jgi:hypothetical protein
MRPLSAKNCTVWSFGISENYSLGVDFGITFHVNLEVVDFVELPWIIETQT